MDTVVVNIIGLINILELRMGLHYEDVSEHERVALYYDAMSKYMQNNPDNVLAGFIQSFRIEHGKSCAELKR